MTTPRALRALGGLAALFASIWVVRSSLARMNGTVVRDVRSGR